MRPQLVRRQAIKVAGLAVFDLVAVTTVFLAPVLQPEDCRRGVWRNMLPHWHSDHFALDYLDFLAVKGIADRALIKASLYALINVLLSAFYGVAKLVVFYLPAIHGDAMNAEEIRQFVVGRAELTEFRCLFSKFLAIRRWTALRRFSRSVDIGAFRQWRSALNDKTPAE